MNSLPPNGPRLKTGTWTAISLLVFIVACVLRAHHLSDALFWHDEVFTQVFSTGHGAADFLELFDGRIRPAEAMAQARSFEPTHGPSQVIRSLARNEPQHPPLFYITASLWSTCWMSLSDSSDIVAEGIRLRWLSFLISIAALPVFYRLGLIFFRDQKRAFVVCAAYAVSPFFVLYAQEAREYSLWALWVAASTAALIHAQRRPSWRRYGMYGLLLSLSLYTSLSTASVILAHIMITLVEISKRRTGRTFNAPEARRVALGFLASLTLAAAIFAPWAWLVMKNYEAMQASMAWSRDIHVSTQQLWSTYALNLSRTVVDSGAETFTAAGVVMALYAFFVGAMAARALTPGQFLKLACLVGAPTLFLLVPDLLTGGIRSVSTRYFIPAFVGLLCSLGALAPSVSEVRRLRTRQTMLAVLLILSAFSSWSITGEAAWPKGVSRALPQVIEVLVDHPDALIVGDHELHHPGNMLALSTMVDQASSFQLLPSVENYVLPDFDGPIFLFSPNPRFRQDLEDHPNVSLELLVEDMHLSLWRVHR